jgi:diaminohydroxyphosphoribosylaminopyrimidine deaminase/5-amino-6-(5-phosphoribosylamino)uracil reductase
MPQGSEEDRDVSAYSPDPSSDAPFMRRAIALAMKGRGGVEPNPMVGCVIVKDGRVIGEGFHETFGGPHAEPNALAACAESPAGATAYVTLEPCCHTNKKTPPCVPKLIEARIGRVVIGCIDPNPDVAGNGIAQLGSAGMDVSTGVLERESRQLIAPFFATITHHRPYVTLKWAQTADGKIAGPGGRRLQISNDASTRAVHELRSRVDAILVGINTVLADDPLLTVRGIGARQANRMPVRMVLDGDLRIPLDSRLVRTAREVPLEVWCHTARLRSDRADELRSLGVEIDELDAWPDPRASRLLSLGELLLVVSGPELPTSHLLAEPGATLASNFFLRNLADRLWLFRSRNRVDDPGAPSAAEIPMDWIKTAEIDLAGDVLSEYLNPRSPVFFTAEPSADFVLLRERGSTSNR